jgi:hypothetical protein
MSMSVHRLSPISGPSGHPTDGEGCLRSSGDLNFWNKQAAAAASGLPSFTHGNPLNQKALFLDYRQQNDTGNK